MTSIVKAILASSIVSSMSIRLFFILLFMVPQALLLNAQTNIYIAPSGSDITGSGELFSPYKSLERAIDDIESQGQITYNLILLAENNGTIFHTESGSGQLVWEKSGSELHPINIFSMNGSAIINPTSNDQAIIKLKNVSYINFNNVIFKNATLAFIFDNADYNTIESCKFIGSTFPGGSGSGTIWIGKLNFNPALYNDNPIPSNQRSDFNIITNNHFSGIVVDTYSQQHLYHAIYISNGSYGNDIYHNTIEMGVASGSGIQHNHGYMEANNINRNFIYKRFDSMEDPYMSSRHGINFQTEENNPIEVSFTKDNNIIGNYLHANMRRIYPDATNCDPENANNNNYKGSQLLRIDAPLCSQNIISQNLLEEHEDDSYIDPLWSEFKALKIAKSMVAGDFNGDGKDDVAAFYNNDSNHMHMYVWSSSTNSFAHQSWWAANENEYDVDRIKGRIVAGDFDGDGNDDVAGFYDHSNNTTALHMWLSSGIDMTFQGDSAFWRSTGYDANKITNRVIAGDFDNNGYDDIAAFYDYDGNHIRLHMWLSSGTHMTYQGGDGWWKTNGYNGNKISNRVVSGDFDGNGYDDIAAFYDYDNNNIRLHTWLSSGTHITYQGGNGWWSTSGYDGNKISNRVVAGDFDGNGKDDIVAFYDYEDDITGIHMWLSSGTYITYQGSNGWWYTEGYDASKITGRVISGDFNNDGKSDIAAFYETSFPSDGIRSHVWHSIGTGFHYVNGSLGYPWIKSNSVTFGRKKDAQVPVKIKEDVTLTAFKVYPNPSSQLIVVEYTVDQKTDVKIEILDVSFQRRELWISGSHNPGKYSLEKDIVGSLSPGYYIIRFKTQKKVITKKLVVVQ